MKKPNVILMFVDDLGVGDISCFNANSGIHTKNVDELAERGMCFCDAHSTSALCTPSRYGLLTGRYSWRGTLKRGVLNGTGKPLIEQGRMTLANLFKQAGYYTAAVGKWHLGMGWQLLPEVTGKEYGAEEEVAAMKKAQAEGKRAVIDMVGVDFTKPVTVSPRSYGFDYFFGLNASLDQPPYTYMENERVTAVPDTLMGVWPLDRDGATMQQCVQRGPGVSGFDSREVLPEMQKKVLSLIDEHADEPFFLYYPTPAVHGPLLPTPEFEGKSGLNLYADVVLQVDAMVGEITEKLKEKGIWENTIFIFTSDNGCSGVADYPFLLSHGHDPSGGYRGKKGDIWEGGHREPCVLSWPAKFAEGKRTDSIMCLSDFFRTFADLLSVPVPDNAGEDSFSLLPLLNETASSVRKSVIHHSAMGFFSIRDKEWKLELCSHSGILPPKGKPEPSCSAEVPYQLYDMRVDPAETTNVAAQHPDIVARMKAELLRQIDAGRTTPGAPQKNTEGEWPRLDELR